MLAAYNAMEMSLRMLKPGKGLKNTDITENITKIAKIYETTPVENMLSHQMERFKTVSDKQIIQNPVEEQKTKIEKCSFEDYEVYAVDILISSGEGKHFRFTINLCHHAKLTDYLRKAQSTRHSNNDFQEGRRNGL